MSVIEARHYGETRAKLKQDPVIIEMASEIREALLKAGLDPTDPPRGVEPPVIAALNEYRKRGGTIATHIGGPAQAIIELLKEDTHGN